MTEAAGLVTSRPAAKERRPIDLLALEIPSESNVEQMLHNMLII